MAFRFNLFLLLPAGSVSRSASRLAVSSGVERRISPLLRSALLKGSHRPKYVRRNPAPSRAEGSVLRDSLQPPSGPCCASGHTPCGGGFLGFLLSLCPEGAKGPRRAAAELAASGFVTSGFARAAGRQRAVPRRRSRRARASVRGWPQLTCSSVSAGPASLSDGCFWPVPNAGRANVNAFLI